MYPTPENTGPSIVAPEHSKLNPNDSYFHSEGPPLLPPSSVGIEDFLRKKIGFDGVQRLDLVPMQSDDWLRVDEAYERQMDLRHKLLEKTPERVSQALPVASTSCHELLHTVCTYLANHYPSKFTYHHGTFTDNTRALTINTSTVTGIEALKQVGHIAQEDMLVVRETDRGTFRMIAGLVCFPSKWDLSARIGQELSEIHGEVPELNSSIGSKIDSLLQRLKRDKPMERMNFLLYPTDTLPLFPDDLDHKEPPFDQQQWYLRSERETLTRLPINRDIVFTLKTYITPLKDLPLRAQMLLADLLEEAPKAYVRDYKNLSDENLSRLLGFLRGAEAPRE